MDQVVCTGALASVDPDPSEELAIWRSDLRVGRIDDPAETLSRLAAYESGKQIIVRLELFADVARDGRVVRFDGPHLRGLWFEAGSSEVNLAYAREMVTSHLEDLLRALVRKHGLELGYEALIAVPVVVQLEPGLALVVDAGP